MNVLDLAQKKVKLRKASNTRGGEWQGPCPGCGGTDRFHVWPEQNQGQGSYWCRGCDKKGDAIQYLRDFEGMTFQAACEYLHIPVGERPEHTTPTQPRSTAVEFTPAEHQLPEDLWRDKAEKLVTWAQQHLLSNLEVLGWLSSRGIDLESVQRYRLGWNPGERDKDLYRARSSWGLQEIKKENGRPRVLWIPRGLVIPAIVNDGVCRIRIRRPEGEPRYYVIPGSSAHTMHIEPARRAVVIVESELDAIAVAGNNTLAGAVAVGTSHGKPDAATYARLKESLQILNALDFDKAGIGAQKWWESNFNNHDRWPVPKGKDPGEAYELGIDLNMWINAGLPPGLTYDLETQPTDRRSVLEEEKPINRTTVSEADILSLDPAIIELASLLNNNPAVTIINTPDRLALLRNGKYVGGRIAHLVFQVPEVTEYILAHPAKRITGGNFIT